MWVESQSIEEKVFPQATVELRNLYSRQEVGMGANVGDR